MEISVVMPLKNGLPWLPDQLAALAGQDWDGQWEFVAADNGCTDGSLKAVRAADIPSVRVADARARAGISHARNAGVAVARGKHVLFCDADDVVDPTWLSSAAAVFATHDFLGGRLRLERLNRTEDLLTRTNPTPEQLPTAFGSVVYAVGANFGVLREAFLDVGGCDERFRVCGDDVDLSWRLGSHGCEPVWAPEVIVDYRFRTGMRNLWRQQRAYGEAQALLEKVHGPQESFRVKARTAHGTSGGPC